MKAFRLALLCSMALAVTAAHSVSAAPLDSVFTYQGQLNQNGSPVSGIAHFRFSLWTAASGGSMILGYSQIVSDVPVSGGIFTVQLKGGFRFNGDARWLRIEVCTDATCSSTTTLSPRQPITASPYALQSLQSLQVSRLSGGVGMQVNPGTTSNAAGVFAGKQTNDLLVGSFLEPGGTAHGFLSTGFSSEASARKISIGRATDPNLEFVATFDPVMTVVTNGGGKVGIGESNPAYPLTFAPTLGDKINIYATPAGDNYGIGIQNNLMQIHSDGSIADIGFGYGSSASFTERMRIRGNGNVGIGTTAPASKLDVRGDIRLGSSGAELAASGSENLRIIRGSINGCGTGTIMYGSGFTLEPGCVTNFTRRITFNTPFSSPPTVTATSTDCAGCPTRFCHIVSVSTTEVRIQEFTRSDGGYSGGPIQFIAIGPR